MAGRSLILTPGRRRRRSAISRSANTGSISSLRPAIWTRNDEWPMKVTPSSSGRNQDGLLRFSGHGPEGRLPHQCSQRLHFEENRALAPDLGFHCHPSFIIDSPTRLRDAISVAKVPHGEYCGTCIDRREASKKELERG